MSWKPNDEFKKWAINHSGYNGGNLSGSIWYSGIEYGQQYENLKEFHEDFKKDTTLIPHCPSSDLPVTLKYPFDIKLFKLNTLLNNERIENYKEFTIKSKALSLEGDIFKFNLYPIACRNTDESLWFDYYYQATGFPTKALYKAWCQENRFPNFKKLRQEHKPKMIICGGNTYERDFLLAFAGEEYLFKKPDNSFENGLVNHYQVDETQLFVIPFFGRPLKSDSMIKKVAEAIQSVQQKQSQKKAA